MNCKIVCFAPSLNKNLFYIFIGHSFPWNKVEPLEWFLEWCFLLSDSQCGICYFHGNNNYHDSNNNNLQRIGRNKGQATHDFVCQETSEDLPWSTMGQFGHPKTKSKLRLHSSKRYSKSKKTMLGDCSKAYATELFPQPTIHLDLLRQTNCTIIVHININTCIT